MNVKEYLALKDRLEEATKVLNRMQGKYDVYVQKLRDDFQCKNVEEAKRLLVKKKKKLADLEKVYQDKLAKFTKDFGDKL